MINEKKDNPGREYWRSGNMLYPVPAVLVTCGGGSVPPNIITVAWAGTVCSDPAMVSVSIRPQRYSHDIIRDSGEFVINLTTSGLARVTDFCGVKSGRDLDKFAECGLTPVPSKHVSCPSIGESPVSIECRVRQILPLGSHDMFLAEVAGVSVASDYIDASGAFRLDKTNPIAYSHGGYYELGRFLGKFGFSVKKKKARRSVKKAKRER